MTTNKPEAFEVYRTKHGTLENVVLLADYEALQAECEKLRKDAERYQWLMQEDHEWPEEVEFAIECQNKSKIDAAIDAAMLGQTMATNKPTEVKK